MKIGVFDSGVGGLTVLNLAIKIIPDAEYIYYADLDNVPYGNKTREEVKRLSFKAIKFLYEMGADAVIIACNTATSTAVNYLRENFDIPIIGMEPALKPAIENSTTGRVIVMATELTLKEEKFRNLVGKLEGENLVDSLPMSELVSMAENYDFSSGCAEDLFRMKLSEFNLEKYSSIVLGCTHFIYFRNILEKIIPINISIIDGNKGTVKHLQKILRDNDKYTKSFRSVRYYVSGRLEVQGEFEKYMNYLNENNI